MAARSWGGADSRRPAAGRRQCERCGADVLRQTTGVPWTVTVDEQRMTPDQAAALTTENRLAWCLREHRWTGMRLVEVLPHFHSPVCTWAHVIAHQCPPGTREYGRRPEGALW